MNLELAHNESVAVPASLIRNPGTHQKTSQENVKSQANKQTLSLKLQLFREQTGTKSNVVSEVLSTQKSNSLTPPKLGHRLGDMVKQTSARSLVGPGKLKTVANEYQNAVHLAREILSIYNMSLSIQVSNRKAKEVYNVLKALIPEVCSFPEGFFRRIRLEKFTIYDDENGTSNTSIDDSIASMRLESMESQELVHQKLYKIILDHIIAIKPEISGEWVDTCETMHSAENIVIGSTRINSLEDTFKALMKNKMYAGKTNTVKELLMRHFPEYINEEWFTKKREAKRQFLQVQFDNERLVTVN